MKTIYAIKCMQIELYGYTEEEKVEGEQIVICKLSESPVFTMSCSLFLSKSIGGVSNNDD